MSSTEHLKQVVSDKLAAVAEEIFAVFHSAILEYEEELDRQRRLLDLAWNPVVTLDRTELPQQLVLKEEPTLEDQSSLNQDWNSTSDQEEEVSSKELKLKEEPVDLQLYSPGVENNSLGDAVVHWDPEEPSQQCEIPASVVSPANSGLSLCPGDSQSQELREDPCATSGSTTHKLKDPNCNAHKSETEGPNVTLTTSKTSLADDQMSACDSNALKHHKSTVDKNQNVHETLQVSSCGTELQHKSVQTGKKQHVCQTCGKAFSKSSILNRHKVLHTGERPYVCQTCSRCFRFHADLRKHEKTHTGERPYSCKTCNKGFTRKDSLRVHEKRHQ